MSDMISDKSKRPDPISSSSSSSDSSFLAGAASAAGAAPLAAAGAAAAAGAEPTPDPTVVIRVLRSHDSRALAKSPGQYGSTSTPAALRMVVIFSGVMATSSSARIKAAYTQASSEFAILCFSAQVSYW